MEYHNHWAARCSLRQRLKGKKGADRSRRWRRPGTLLGGRKVGLTNRSIPHTGLAEARR